MDCNDDSKEERRHGMVVGLGKRSAGVDRDFPNKGLIAEVVGNNSVVRYREADLQSL